MTAVNTTIKPHQRYNHSRMVEVNICHPRPSMALHILQSQTLGRWAFPVPLSFCNPTALDMQRELMSFCFLAVVHAPKFLMQLIWTFSCMSTLSLFPKRIQFSNGLRQSFISILWFFLIFGFSQKSRKATQFNENGVSAQKTGFFDFVLTSDVVDDDDDDDDSAMEEDGVNKRQGWSWPLVLKMVETLQNSAYDFEVETCCILNHNTSIGPNGHPMPTIRGFVVDTQTLSSSQLSWIVVRLHMTVVCCYKL